MLLVSLISYIDRNTLALLAPTILQGNRPHRRAVRLHHLGLLHRLHAGQPAVGPDPGPRRTAPRHDRRRGLLDRRLGGARLRRRASGPSARRAPRWASAKAPPFPAACAPSCRRCRRRQRGRGLAVAYSGGSLGAVVTPLIVTPIFLWWGWRGAFWFTGLIGAAWLAMWAVVSRRTDIRHRTGSVPA